MLLQSLLGHKKTRQLAVAQQRHPDLATTTKKKLAELFYSTRHVGPQPEMIHHPRQRTA